MSWGKRIAPNAVGQVLGEAAFAVLQDVSKFIIRHSPREDDKSFWVENMVPHGFDLSAFLKSRLHLYHDGRIITTENVFQLKHGTNYIPDALPEALQKIALRYPVRISELNRRLDDSERAPGIELTARMNEILPHLKNPAEILERAKQAIESLPEEERIAPRETGKRTGSGQKRWLF